MLRDDGIQRRWIDIGTAETGDLDVAGIQAQY